MEIRLDGRRALVTGGNSGLGAGIARALADAGAQVAINYIVHPDAAEAIAEDIRAKGGTAMTVKADVSDTTEVPAMFRAIDDAWGGIDILVNNAGIDGKPIPAWEGDPESWRRVIDINLFGTHLCAREALSRMVPAKSGVILNMSSVHELIAWTGYSAYAASKAGVSMLSKTLAQEAAPYGVRVLALAPGAIQTDINRDVWEDAEMLADLKDKIPLARMGQVEEVARMAVVLVSPVASYVTGTTIFVDGGMLDYPDFARGG